MIDVGHDLLARYAQSEKERSLASVNGMPHKMTYNTQANNN